MMSRQTPTTDGTPRWRTRQLAVVIFLIAVALRFGFVASLGQSVYLHAPHSDQLSYFHWAHLLRSGATPPLALTVQQPAYAYFLSLWSQPGREPPFTLVRFVHILIGGTAAAFLFLITRRVLGNSWGFLAALLYTASPIVIFTEASWSKEALALTLWLLVLWWFPSRKPGGRIVAVLAFILAPGLRDLYLFPLSLALLAWQGVSRRSRQHAILFFCSVVAAGLAVTWGWGTFHTWVRRGNPPQGFAQPLYVGVWAGSGILYSPPDFLRGGRIWEADDWRRETIRRLGRAVDPRAENRYWLRAAGREFLSHPSHTLHVMLLRIAASLWGGSLEDNYPYLVYYQRSRLLQFLPPVWLLFTLGIGGIWIWFCSGRQRMAWWMVTAIILGTLVVTAPFYALERFRLPLYPCFAVTAAAGCKFLTTVKRRHLLAYLLAAVIAINPWITARLFAPIYQGTAIGWKVLAQTDLAAGYAESARDAYAHIAHLPAARQDPALQPLRDLCTAPPAL